MTTSQLLVAGISNSARFVIAKGIFRPSAYVRINVLTLYELRAYNLNRATVNQIQLILRVGRQVLRQHGNKNHSLLDFSDRTRVGISKLVTLNSETLTAVIFRSDEYIRSFSAFSPSIISTTS